MYTEMALLDIRKYMAQCSPIPKKELKTLTDFMDKVETAVNEMGVLGVESVDNAEIESLGYKCIPVLFDFYSSLSDDLFIEMASIYFWNTVPHFEKPVCALVIEWLSHINTVFKVSWALKKAYGECSEE